MYYWRYAIKGFGYKLQIYYYMDIRALILKTVLELDSVSAYLREACNFIGSSVWIHQQA